MSRIDNKVQQTPPQQQSNKPQVQQKAGEKSAFAQRFNQPPKKKELKQQQPKAKANVPQKGDAKTQDQSTALLQRQGATFIGRRGGNTVADLQAKLQGQPSAGKGLQDASSLTTDGKLDPSMLAKGADQGKGDLLKSMAWDTFNQNTGADNSSQLGPGQPQIQQANGQNTIPSQSIQVQGKTIPTAMLDKIVDQARVGVNSTGAPEFQFDLKGDVLGGLKMRINMENGQVNAVFLAENSDVRRFIDGNLENLRKALADKGIDVNKLEIRDPNDQQRDQQNQQNQRDRQNAMDQD